MPEELSATVIVVSDEVLRGEREDRAGQVAVAALAEHGVLATAVVVGDAPDAIAQAVKSAVQAGHRVVITAGGTGIGPTDVTVGTISDLVSYEIPGIAEEIRRRGAAATSLALVSRGIAGVVVGADGPRCFVLTAPGSRGGVRDAVAVAGPLLHYIVGQLDGDGHQ